MKQIKINKKGAAVDLFIWMIVAVVIIIFFGLWLWMFNTTTDIFKGMTSTQYVNISDATEKTFSQVNDAQNTWVPILGYMMILSMALTILLSNFLVKSHPAFFVVYVLIVIGAVISSVYLSNYYETLMQDAVFGATFQTTMSGGSFIILNLPIFVTVIGLFGAIFLFAGILRDSGAGGGI